MGRMKETFMEIQDLVWQASSYYNLDEKQTILFVKSKIQTVDQSLIKSMFRELNGE